MSRAAPLVRFELSDELLPFPPTHELDRLLPSVGLARVGMSLEVDEIDDVIASRVTLRVPLCSMLLQPALKMVGDARIEETSISIAQDVDVIGSQGRLLRSEVGSSFLTRRAPAGERTWGFR